MLEDKKVDFYWGVLYVRGTMIFILVEVLNFLKEFPSFLIVFTALFDSFFFTKHF